MNNGKITLAIIPLSTCAGCENTILDLEEKLFFLADFIDIVYAPIIMDSKPPSSVDIAIFTGAIRTDEDERKVKVWRKKCKILVALGSCATLGGIPGLANLTTVEDLLKQIYVNHPNVQNPRGTEPNLDIPKLVNQVKILKDLVKVDYSIPGCPPPKKLVEKFFQAMINGGEFKLPDKSVCDECPLNTGEKKVMEKIKRWGIDPVDPNKCLLEQGFLCLGPVTRSGCEARCIRAGYPCRGCMGPPKGITDQAADMISVIGSIVSLDKIEVEDLMKIKDLSGSLYRFTLPSSTFKGKIRRKLNG